jgi:tartrate-resistant acid phosphatase type 5
MTVGLYDGDQRITRREVIRRSVVFAAGAVVAGRGAGLRAAPAVTGFDSGGMHLLALGDYGTKGNANQRAVAKAMATFAKSLDAPLDAVLALGDNFYKKITPGRFANHFEKLYSTDGLDCPFYACAGNHDYGTAKYDYQKGKLQMQLDYAKNNPHSRWKMPAKWYTVELPSGRIGLEGGQAHFAPKTPHDHRRDGARPVPAPLVKMIVLDGNYWEGALTPKEKLTQRRFLEAELAKPSRAPWLWVVNHFPIFSECKDRGDNKRLIQDWGKLIQGHSVSLCIAGHDHTMQHLRAEGFQPSFLVSGAGGASLYDVRPSKRGFVDNHQLGFTHIHVTREELQVQFIDAAGNCLHHFRRDPAGNVTVLT